MPIKQSIIKFLIVSSIVFVSGVGSISAQAAEYGGYYLPFPAGVSTVASQTCVDEIDPLGVNCKHSGSPQNKYAVDFTCSRGDAIVATKAGTVVLSEQDPNPVSYGNTIKIKHSDGYYSLYAHLDSRSVFKDNVVLQGGIIGTCGDTGAEFVHLHFEKRGTSGSLPTIKNYFEECKNNILCHDGQLKCNLNDCNNSYTSQNSPAPIIVPTTESKVESIVFNGRLYQFSKRLSDNKLFSRYYNGSTWSSWEQRAASAIFGEPSVFVFKSKLYLAIHSTINNSLQTQSLDTTDNWSVWQSGGSITLKGKPVMSEVGSRLFQFGFGTDNKLYTRSTLDGANWGSWVYDTVTLNEEISAIKFNVNDVEKLFISAFGTDSRLYTKILNSDGTVYSQWQEGLGITIKGKPVMETLGSTLYQFAYGADNKLYIRTTTGTTWSNWDGDTITLNDEISVTKNSSYLVLSAYGSDNKLYTKLIGTSASNLWQEGNAITIKDEPSSVEYSGRIYQSVRGTDNKIWTRSARTNLINGYLDWNGWVGVTFG